MAVIKFTNSKSNIKRIIDYITQDNKTDDDLITGKDCMADTSYEEMSAIKNI